MDNLPAYKTINNIQSHALLRWSYTLFNTSACTICISHTANWKQTDYLFYGSRYILIKRVTVVMAFHAECSRTLQMHVDVIKWKYFPRYWPILRGIHRSQVNSPHKGQWRGALMFSLICAWINGRASTHEASDLRRHRAHYDVTVMELASADILDKSLSPRIYESAVTVIQMPYIIIQRKRLATNL